FQWLLDNTDIDMIMPGMNILTRGLEPVLVKARSKNVAVVAMKTLSAAKKIDYSKYMKDGRTARQGLIKWMLAQPNIDTISISMRTFDDIDEYIAVSGDPELSSREERLMKGYASMLEKDYCRPGCDGCLDAWMPAPTTCRYTTSFVTDSTSTITAGKSTRWVCIHRCQIKKMPPDVWIARGIALDPALSGWR
ncbi:MAG: hypothetical protein KOO63_13950, partial [Bacteroidales bacterium]|nr:hypothetical protein [Candidatus Latescibacterota bacterium]